MAFFKSFSWLWFIALIFSHDLFADHQVALHPSIKPVDRDWSYFKSIPCKDIEKVVFHSSEEERLLAKRKKQCMDRYKAFYSSPNTR